MAKKKSFRSAPRMVSGRESDRCTLLIRLVSAMCCTPPSRSRKEPSQKVHRSDRHSHAEQHAREDPFGSPFPKSESESGHDDCNERESARDGAGKRGHEHVDRVLPRRIALLREGRCGEEKYEADCDYG